MQQTSHRPPKLDTRRFRIADLEVDVARVVVRRGDVELSLPRLSFDMLLALAEIAPAVATTDMLLQRVWPGLVVNPETVSQRVKLLRTVLGDDPRQPRYVAGVRGRGYRLLPQVELLPPPEAPLPRPSLDSSAAPVAASSPAVPQAPEDALPPAPESESAPAPVPRRRVAWFALPAVVLAALAVALVVARRESVERVAPRGGEAADVATPGTSADERSIVVMPFDAPAADVDAGTLARGIEESLTYQLAALPQLLVIARASARAAARENLDAVELGRRLQVRYLLEGSVQRIAGRARVIATLVDARDGVGLWSAQLDRPSRDVFAIQDEIGASVARALQLRLETPRGNAARRGTRRFDAWLQYLQGRELAASGVVADLPRAIERLSLALRIDPGFARAHVELARAELLAAEYADPATRDATFAAAAERAHVHVSRALELDPGDGRAYLQRAYLESFTDPAAAEADFRRGLALNPSEAEGWEGLAALSYRDPARSAEALEQIERARRLDPLEPRYDVTKSVFLLYRRGDVRGAESLLRGVLGRHPRYVPALARLGEALWCCSSDMAGGIRYLEQALGEDPQSEWTRRALVQAYAVLGETAAVEALARAPITAAAVAADEYPATSERATPRMVRLIPWYVAVADWRAAGDTALRGFADGSVLEIDEDVATFAVRRRARELDRAALLPVIDLLAERAGVRWDAAGAPVADADPGLMSSRVGLADLLQLSGDAARARRLLDLILADMQRQSSQSGRGLIWFAWSRPLALMLRGEREAALAALEAGEAGGALHHHARHYTLHDPVLQPLQSESRFRRIVAAEKRWLEAQRAELRAARASGLAPASRR